MKTLTVSLRRLSLHVAEIFSRQSPYEAMLLSHLLQQRHVPLVQHRQLLLQACQLPMQFCLLGFELSAPMAETIESMGENNQSNKPKRHLVFFQVRRGDESYLSLVSSSALCSLSSCCSRSACSSCVDDRRALWRRSLSARSDATSSR